MIFYFSGTGNTKWAASKLAAATREDLISIAPYMRADDSSHNLAEPFILKENERLGFVFPVHGWRVPKLVREFISKMKILREPSDATVGNKAKADDRSEESPFRLLRLHGRRQHRTNHRESQRGDFPESFASGSGHYGGFILLLLSSCRSRTSVCRSWM